MHRLSTLLCLAAIAGCGVNAIAPQPMAKRIPSSEVRWEEQFNKNRPYEPHGPPTSGSAASNENLLQSFLIFTVDRVGADQLVAALQDEMRGPPQLGKERAHQVLAAIALIRRDTDTSEALQVLIKALDDRDEWAARFTAQMLPRLSPASLPALPALAKASNRTDQAAQSAALAVAQFGLDGVPHLIEALRDQDSGKPVSTLWASHGLAEVGPLAVPLLIDALAGQHPNVRFGACFALGRIGQQSLAAEPALIPLLSDSEPRVRGAAAEALQRMNCRSMAVITALIVLAEDADGQVRGAAAQALGVLGKEDLRTSGVLLRLADDRVPKVRRLAVHALGELGPAAQEAWSRLHEGYQGAEPLERYGYAEALLRIDAAAAAEAGITLQSLSHMPVRHSAPGE